AHGLLAERFAFCQTLPLADLAPLAEVLRPAGYRPVRVRPYRDGTDVRVAAVWLRDGRPWRLALDLRLEEALAADTRARGERFLGRLQTDVTLGRAEEQRPQRERAVQELAEIEGKLAQRKPQPGVPLDPRLRYDRARKLSLLGRLDDARQQLDELIADPLT